MTLGGTTLFAFPWLSEEERRCWVERFEIAHPCSTQVHLARNSNVDHEVLIVSSGDLKLKKHQFAIGIFDQRKQHQQQNICRAIIYLSHKKYPGWLDYIGDDILANYIGIIVSHNKDPYKPTRVFLWLTCGGRLFEGNPAPNKSLAPWHPITESLPPVGRWHGFMLQQRQQRMPRCWVFQ